MSAKTTIEFFCDRCSVSIGVDKKPNEKLTVKAGFEGERAVEFAYDWKHFCGSCHRDVVAFFSRRIKPSESEGREG